jgi:hypothetical protein
MFSVDCFFFSFFCLLVVAQFLTMLETVSSRSLHLDSVVGFPLPVVGFLKFGYLKHWGLLDEV